MILPELKKSAGIKTLIKRADKWKEGYYDYYKNFRVYFMVVTYVEMIILYRRKGWENEIM